jgi:uroporphyrinogen-III synthase
MLPTGRSLRLVVTRPQPQADEWVARLLALQQSALALPLLRIESDPAHARLVAQAWVALAQQRLVMFVSPSAVARFFLARPDGLSWPTTTWAAATGMGTVAALRAHGVPESLIVAPSPQSPQFDAETLWSQALASMDWHHQSVLIVRGEEGRDWLADKLGRHGAEVQALSAYQRLGPEWCSQEQALLAQIQADPAGHAWLFSSSEAIHHLMRRADAFRVGAMVVVATHERIARTARDLGFQTVLSVPPDPLRIAHVLQSYQDSPLDRYNRAPAAASSPPIAP